MDKRSEFLRDVEKLEFKLNEILRVSEMRNFRPLCNRFRELQRGMVYSSYSISSLLYTVREIQKRSWEFLGN